LLTHDRPQGFMDYEIVDKSLLKTRKFAWVAILFGAIGLGTIFVNAAFNFSLQGTHNAMGKLGISSLGKSGDKANGTVAPGPRAAPGQKDQKPGSPSSGNASNENPVSGEYSAKNDLKNSKQASATETETSLKVPEVPGNFEKMINDILLAKPAEFRPGSPILSWNGKTNLDQILPLLKAKPDWKFEIGAHIPPSDTPEADRVVTERRAEAVAGYLGTEGISNIRMSVRGYGSSKPIADNTTDIGRLKNQRIEIRVLSTQ
jgi:outer membrane protein OmpA-like peptidoglycan-associated protein